MRPNLSFLRDSNQNEIDLIIELAGKVIPLEIKASQTMSSRYFETLSWFQKETRNKQDAVVVYGGDKNQTRIQGKVVSWHKLDTLVKNL